MKRQIILLVGLLLCGMVALVPNGAPMKKIGGLGFELELEKLDINKLYVVFALAIVSLLLIVSYFHSWSQRRTIKLSEAIKGRIRIGWDEYSDRSEINNVMWQHRANVISLIVFDFLPGTIIFVVTTVMIWQYAFGGRHV